jgi:iron complex transport system ATP-binding protein
VQFRYPASPSPAIADVTATIEAGRFTALIGPNGSGKSTLIRLLLGAGKPEAGEIRFGGRPLNEWSRRDLARTIGVVPQNEEITFPLTVRELASMGRYPHLGPLQAPRPGDRATVDRALDQCDVLAFADRPFQSLSGGERQRARLARALAQEPSVLALDEPTLALDIGHEMRIFELARSFADTGSTVLLATHNLNLAARFADRMLLLADGRLLADGPPDTVLRRDLLETAYEWPLLTTAYPGPGPDTGAVQVVAVRSEKE